MSVLPKTVTPEYELKLISNNKQIKYRPFLVKEEKILLLASEHKDSSQMFNAILRVLSDCTFEKIVIEDLPLFDIENLFIAIRSKSVGETVTPSILCSQCKKYTPTTIDVSTAHPIINPAHNRRIILDPENGVQVILGYPSFASLSKSKKSLDNFVKGVNVEASIYEMICNCIETIIVTNKNTGKDDVFHKADIPAQEMQDFVEGLTLAQFGAIRTFFDTLPKIVCNVQFKCEHCHHSEQMELGGLNDFFG